MGSYVVSYDTFDEEGRKFGMSHIAIEHDASSAVSFVSYVEEEATKKSKLRSSRVHSIVITSVTKL